MPENSSHSPAEASPPVVWLAPELTILELELTETGDDGVYESDSGGGLLS